MATPAISTCDVAKEIVNATRSVVGSRENFVALHEPEFRGNEKAYLADCIDTGWVSSVGKYVDRIEDTLVEITGVRRAIATVNGTAALHVCLLLAGVLPGDEVLVPTLTFVATINAVSYCQAVPHFVDSERSSLGIDADKLDGHLTDIAEIRDGVCRNRVTGAPIRALIVMHVFGHPGNLDALSQVARRWQVTLIEDAAELLGSSYHGTPTGNHGRVAALSFNGNKLITTGGGGAILTNDEKLGARAKHLTTTARTAHRWNFVHDEVGFNYRMPNVNAALGCAQLERLDDMLARKRMLAERYKAAFADIAGAEFLVEPEGTRSNYWLNTIVLKSETAPMRDSILDALNGEGMMARPAWTLMHRLPMYASAPRSDVTVAEDMERRVINLPSSPHLAD